MLLVLLVEILEIGNDRRPGIERQVDQEGRKPGRNHDGDHAGKAVEPALEISDRRKDRWKGNVSLQLVGEQARDENPEDPDQGIEHVAEDISVRGLRCCDRVTHPDRARCDAEVQPGRYLPPFVPGVFIVSLSVPK